MSYEHGTPFVDLPQTVGSDKRDWFDTNDAFRDLDAKLKTAYEGASSSAEGLVEVNARVDEMNTTVSQHTTDIESINAHLSTTDENVAVNSTAINGLQTEVRDNKQDLKDSICSIEELTATAQYRHEVDTYFWYNDTLYKTTVLIAVNQQIVPNVNCDTTNITTELLNGGSGGEVSAIDVSLAPITGMTATEVQSGISELNGFFGTLMFRVESGTGNAQYSKDGGTTWVNFKNPVGTKSITANGTYDVTDYASANVNVPNAEIHVGFSITEGVGYITQSLYSSGTNYGDVTASHGQQTNTSFYPNVYTTSVSASACTITLQRSCLVDGTTRASGSVVNIPNGSTVIIRPIL